MVDYEKTDPISKFTKEEFGKILDKETEGTIEEKTIDEYWEKYHEKDYSIQLIINKANALKRDMSKTNNHRTVVLFGSMDHVFSDKETKQQKKPFQSFVTVWDCDEKKFTKFEIQGSPKLASRKVEWGKKCKVSTDIEKTISKGTTYINEHLQRVDEYLDDGFKLEDFFKNQYALPEHITKEVADKYPYAVLYGEIVKIGFITTYNEESEEYEKESPYFKTLDNTGTYIPCFKFTLRSPKELGLTNEHKTVWINLKTQYYGRTIFNVDGWNDKSARNLAQLDVAEGEVDAGKMEEELNDMLGGGAIKVFVVGKFGKWNVSKEVAYINFNATAVFQTKFLPDKAITKDDSLSRILGKKVEKDTKADIERLKVQVKRNIEINDIDVSYDILKEMGTFDGFDYNENICQRIVEKVRQSMKEEKSGSKKSDKEDEDKKEKKEEKKESKSEEKKDEKKEKKKEEKKESKSEEKKKEPKSEEKKESKSEEKKKPKSEEKKESKSEDKKEKPKKKEEKKEKSILDELEENEAEEKKKKVESEKKSDSESKSVSLSDSELKELKEMEDTVEDSLNDFNVDECIGMLKREVRKILHDNNDKFAIWKKTRLEDIETRYKKYKEEHEASKKQKKEDKKEKEEDKEEDNDKDEDKEEDKKEEDNDKEDKEKESESEPDEDVKENLQKALKENNMSKEAKAIALFILKKDTDNTGVNKKVIIEKFRPDHKLDEINEALDALNKAKIINEPQKGCFSIGSVD